MRVGTSALGLLGVLVVHWYFFAVSTSSLAARIRGVERLPPIARRLATLTKDPRGVLSLIADLFWLSMTLVLPAILIAQVIKFGLTLELAAFAAAVAVDVGWLSFLMSRSESRTRL